MTVRAGAAEAVRTSRFRRRLGAWLLWSLGVAALVGVVGSLVYLRTFPPFATVMSSSMEPSISVGDVVVMRALDEPPRVGDVVRFDVGLEARQKANYPSSVIHRVVEVDLEKQTLRTKGDNMSNPDPFTVPFGAVDGKVVLTVPFAGRFLGFFASPFGLLWLGIGLLLLVVLPFYDLHRERTDLEEVEVVALGAIESKIEDLERVALVPEVVVPADDEVKETLRELVAAVGEYGEHLRSHTEVLKAMSEASRDLADVVASMRGAVAMPAAAPGCVGELLGRLRETAPGGAGFATVAELALVLGVEVASVRAALDRLVSDEVVEVSAVGDGRFRYRLL